MPFQFKAFGVAMGISMSILTNLSAQTRPETPIIKKEFPKQVSFSTGNSKYTLKLTGTADLLQTQGDRSRILLSVAHYMENPPTGDSKSTIATILKSAAVKQIDLVVYKDFGAGRFSSRLDTYLKRSLSASEQQKIQRSYAAMMEYLSGTTKKDDRFCFRWLPNGRFIIVAPNQPEKVITDEALGPLFWKAWFGEFSPVNRTELVSFLSS